MENRLKELLDELGDVEKKINQEVDRLQKQLHYTIEKGKVRFEKERLKYFKGLQKGFLRYFFDSSILTILTAPFIYMMLLPALMMDILASVYQTVCFPVYRIPKVKRNEYIVLDRHKLTYLNLIERMNCVYCGYFNGVIAYVREIASRTELYWCPIRHALKVKGHHNQYHKFLQYGEAENYYERVADLRNSLRNFKQ